MRPTQDLVHEHEIVSRALAILDKLCNKIENGEKIDSSHVLKIVDFLVGFVDKCHHAKEEELLFTAIERVLGDQARPMIQQMGVYPSNETI